MIAAGTRVRLFGSLQPILGIVVDDVRLVGDDGGERQRVRWQEPNGRQMTNAWDPALLFPFDSDPRHDPDEVVSGSVVWRHPRLYEMSAESMGEETWLVHLPRTQATPVKRLAQLRAGAGTGGGAVA